MTEGICHIIGASENFCLPLQPMEQDLIIAADGGYRRLQARGLHPHVVVGDFDSLGQAPLGEQVITLPKVKDVTDTWAAVKLATERGYRHFRLYGCTGGRRFGHTLANLQTAADLAAQGMECLIYTDSQIITALSGGRLDFDAAHTGFLSIFSHTDRCTGVTLRGLKYELENAELTNRFPLGVSNEFLGVPASVSVAQGVLILVFDQSSTTF